MEKRKIPLVDRLRDRGFIDQWGFIAFASVGFTAIVSAKWMGLATLWVAAGAVILMLLYAFVVGSSGTGRVRADQAGDNCYYLGLIYTLASLSYAIATFDPNDTASTIVQGFGIALATTIFGLILRVFFNQGRPDLENVEEQARLELTAASSRLKAELGEVVRQMNDFSRHLRQSMNEHHEGTTSSIEGFAKLSTESLRSVVDAATETIRAEANDFASRSKRYDASFSRLLTKLDEHSESLEPITAAHIQLKAAAEATQSAVTSANVALGAFSQLSGEIGAAVSSVRETSSATSRTAEQLLATIKQIEEAVKAVRSETDAQLSSLRSGPAEVVSGAMETLRLAAANLTSEFEKVSTTHQGMIETLTQQADAALTAARRHNEELEGELQRSRNAASRVHGALVDMTDKLARHVEGRA